MAYRFFERMHTNGSIHVLACSRSVFKTDQVKPPARPYLQPSTSVGSNICRFIYQENLRYINHERAWRRRAPLHKPAQGESRFGCIFGFAPPDLNHWVVCVGISKRRLGLRPEAELLESKQRRRRVLERPRIVSMKVPKESPSYWRKKNSSQKS